MNLHPRFDMHDDNMNYHRNCFICKKKYIGRKRSVICPACERAAVTKKRRTRIFEMILIVSTFIIAGSGVLWFIVLLAYKVITGGK